MGGTFVCIECDFTQCAVENKSTASGCHMLEELKCPFGYEPNWHWVKGVGSADVISVPSHTVYFPAHKIEIINSQRRNEE